MNVWPKSNKLFPSVQTFHTHNCLFFRQSGYSEGIFKRLISPSESLDRRMSGSPSMAIPRPRLLRVCLLDGRLTVSPGMDKRLLRQGAPGQRAGRQAGRWADDCLLSNCLTANDSALLFSCVWFSSFSACWRVTHPRGQRQHHRLAVALPPPHRHKIFSLWFKRNPSVIPPSNNLLRCLFL